MDIDDVDLSFVRNMIDKEDDHTEHQIKFCLHVRCVSANVLTIKILHTKVFRLKTHTYEYILTSPNNKYPCPKYSIANVQAQPLSSHDNNLQ